MEVPYKQEKTNHVLSRQAEALVRKVLKHRQWNGHSAARDASSGRPSVGPHQPVL